METLTHNDYYKKMFFKGRMVPLIAGDRLGGFLTFYIGFKDEEKKFIRDDMWDVLDDNEKGDVCFVDHLRTDKHKDNLKFSRIVWHRFKAYIKSYFPNVKSIYWKRWKNDDLFTYKEKIR